MFQVRYIKGERKKSLMDVDEGTFIRKRKRTGETVAERGARLKTARLAKPKVKRKDTPLQRMRKQTIARRKELTKIIKETNRELRQITKDLGVLKRPKA